MAVIASPPPVPTHYHQGSTHEGYAVAGPSNSQNAQLSAWPSPQLTSGAPTNKALASGEGTHSGRQGKQKLAYGQSSTGDSATTGPSYNILPEHQVLMRSRTEEQNLVHRPRTQLLRTKSDFGHQASSRRSTAVEETGELRHGWEDQYNSTEFLGLLSSVSVR